MYGQSVTLTREQADNPEFGLIGFVAENIGLAIQRLLRADGVELSRVQSITIEREDVDDDVCFRGFAEVA
jgi:hypothetical protein